MHYQLIARAFCQVTYTLLFVFGLVLSTRCDDVTSIKLNRSDVSDVNLYFLLSPSDLVVCMYTQLLAQCRTAAFWDDHFNAEHFSEPRR